MTELLKEPPNESLPPDLPQNFGYKVSWFAVKSADPQVVATALGLHDMKPATWGAGIPKAYGQSVFITPCLAGWVLAVGWVFGLEDNEKCLTRLNELSKRFGEAQFFSTHRVVELHAWARSMGGTLLCAYGYCGENGEMYWDVRPRLPDEPALEGGAFPDEQDVMAVAGHWSVDPTKLNQMGLSPSLGLLGQSGGRATEHI